MSTRIRHMALLLLVCVASAGSTIGQKKLAASEAKEHYGESATVCGEVVSGRYAQSSKGQPTFLNLDQAYPNQVFTVVIWGDERQKFGAPENDFKGKRICVSGKITAYDGKPEIVAVDPKQIAVESKK